jgi:hypothetical protein
MLMTHTEDDEDSDASDEDSDISDEEEEVRARVLASRKSCARPSP